MRIAAQPGITVASLQIVGNAFLTRGALVKPVTIVGVLPEKISAISKIKENLTPRSADIHSNRIVLGQELVKELGLRLGQTIRLTPDQDIQRDYLLSGIFSTGIESIDKKTGHIDLNSARGLFDLVDGITRIEARVADIDEAIKISEDLPLNIFIKATPWGRLRKRNLKYVKAAPRLAPSGTE